jgi:hypothetical protein
MNNERMNNDQWQRLGHAAVLLRRIVNFQH